MPRPFLMCLTSSILGAALALTSAYCYLSLRNAPPPESPMRRDAAAALQGPLDAVPTDAPVQLVRHAFTPDARLTPEERVNIGVYESVNMSVVNISTQGRSTGFLLLELPSEGTGSGSVLDKAGHILTNNHVVSGARRIEVTLHDGSSYLAQVVGTDPTNDIAVVRIDAPAELLRPVTFGDSSELRVGQRVFAIGNPFGLERTLTTGIISSVNRTLPGRNHRTLKSIIQIDAAINPGNSGGPLLDTQGTLIGMNMAIASRTGQSSGVGFAIPVNTIARIVPPLIERGRVVRPDIGIEAVYKTSGGLRIAQLTDGGPAQQAGLRGPRVSTRRHGLLVVESTDRSAADLIVAVDNTPVVTVDDFLTAIESRRPGDEVVVTVVREGREQRIPVRLAGGES